MGKAADEIHSEQFGPVRRLPKWCDGQNQTQLPRRACPLLEAWTPNILFQQHRPWLFENSYISKM
jgi:hypothetical protein